MIDVSVSAHFPTGGQSASTPHRSLCPAPHSAMPLVEKDVDLNGFKRGMHEEGAHVCEQYVFTVPGYDGTVWGWNDVRGFDCRACGRPATQHVVLKAPELPVPRPKAAPAVPAAVQMIDPMNLERNRTLAAEEAAKYETTDMLDDFNDPLALHARPKPPPPPPPQPAAPPPPPADLQSVQDPTLSEMLRKDADYNAAFKREVERMVQEKLLSEQLDKNKTPDAPVQALAGGERPIVTVPKDTFADAAALLASVNLQQYQSRFDEEAMDPPTLIEVLEQQGKTALDEALKELGIKSMGHRLKIINAMIVV
ncbi:hypothetical protein AB1Y20_020636 [Prymnesium parvum]|uniref:SAM domain-containing protein n=1 Tax=Prymnesium parvum TaxID=97485 RepID=A0AB34JYL7_PRYPA